MFKFAISIIGGVQALFKGLTVTSRLLFVFILFCSSQVLAGEPTTKPILHIEAGMHTAMVRVIRYDKIHHRVVTVSIDKTIRIWQLSSWQQVRVIRVPSEGINEGKLAALAVSPDGHTLAVGGWTGWDWDKAGSVYLFNADNGEMIRRISGLKNIISYIAYSPDGRFLAVGLGGKAGLQVFETEKYTKVAEDLEYGDRVAYVEYSPKDDTLVTSADDGYIRIYNPKHKLIVRQSIGISKQLGGIRVSPDGSKAVFGIQDVSMAVVVSIPDMRVLAKLTADDVKGQRGLCCIAWSMDGNYVYANGYYEGHGDTPIYRWHVPEFNQRKVITAAGQRIESMFPMENGNLLYVTEDPAFGVIDKSGQRIRYIRSPIGDFREGYSSFRVSQDGSEIEFPMSRAGGEIGRFSVSTLKYRIAEREVQAAGLDDLGKVSHSKRGSPGRKQGRLLPAIRNSAYFALADWESRQSPKLNGQPLPVRTNEFVRSFAVSPDQRFMLLGTEWYLRLYDRQGKVVWEKQAPGVAWNVNITGDGRLAIATFGDGTIRWYRLQDGMELLALFPHSNGHDWVLWRPDGYYASSENGDNYVGWQINRGKDQTPDFYLAIQFERLFYRPDLLRNVLKQKAGTENAAKPGFITIDQIRKIAPPRIKIIKSTEIVRSNTAYLDLEFDVKDKNLSITGYGVYINGIPALSVSERKLSDSERHIFSRHLELPLFDKKNQIRIEAVNTRSSLGLGYSYTNLSTAAKLSPPKGDLYVLAVGVNHFSGFSQSEDMDLEFAANDADEVIKFFEKNNGSLFRHVHTRLLSDDSSILPTNHNIRNSLSFIHEAGPNDTVVLFLASHGFSDPAGNYFFLPRDGAESEVRAVLSGESKGDSTLIGWKDFFNALRKASGRRMLLVDTCNARGITGKYDATSLMKRSAASLFATMVASQSDEFAQDYPQGKHGLFTYSLLEGLKNATVDNSDRIDLEGVFEYTLSLVKELKGQQTPDLIAPLILRETELSVPKISVNTTGEVPNQSRKTLVCDRRGFGTEPLVGKCPHEARNIN